MTAADGRDYLDFFAGILTNMLGYDNPAVRQAIEEQAATGILHTSTLYLLRGQIELAEKIARLSGIPDAKVFFTCSGTEANEAAMLLATQARHSNQVIALRNSYHGRGFGTVAVTGNRGWSASSLSPVQVVYAQGGRPVGAFAGLDDRGYIDACVADLRDLLATATAGDVACMIAEPVQGVGGFTIPPDGLLGAYAEVLAEHGILFISDEVQTGWGRTGDHFWGYEAHGLRPDAITFAKGIGNGTAIGGVVARADLMDCLNANSISTFGGNPLPRPPQRHARLRARARPAEAGGRRRTAAARRPARRGRRPPRRADVRGKGLMIGVELARPGTGEPDPAAAAAVLEATRDRGLLIGKGGLYGNCLRVSPPLTLGEADAREGLGLLVDAIRATLT